MHAGQCLQRRVIGSGGQLVGRGPQRCRSPRCAHSTREATGRAAFLALGRGAASWLIEAAAGTRRIRPKMAEAVTVAKRQVPGEVDRVLGIARWRAGSPTTT